MRNGYGIVILVVVMVFLGVFLGVERVGEDTTFSHVNISSEKSKKTNDINISLDKPKKTTGSKTYVSNAKGLDAYDEGYEAICEDEDYDIDRYYEDTDYADGVDDAMDEWDEEW